MELSTIERINGCDSAASLIDLLEEDIEASVRENLGGRRFTLKNAPSSDDGVSLNMIIGRLGQILKDHPTDRNEVWIAIHHIKKLDLDANTLLYKSDYTTKTWTIYRQILGNLFTNKTQALTRIASRAGWNYEEIEVESLRGHIDWQQGRSHFCSHLNASHAPGKQQLQAARWIHGLANPENVDFEQIATDLIGANREKMMRSTFLLVYNHFGADKQGKKALIAALKGWINAREKYTYPKCDERVAFHGIPDTLYGQAALSEHSTLEDFAHFLEMETCLPKKPSSSSHLRILDALKRHNRKGIAVESLVTQLDELLQRTANPSPKLVIRIIVRIQDLQDSGLYRIRKNKPLAKKIRAHCANRDNRMAQFARRYRIDLPAKVYKFDKRTT